MTTAQTEIPALSPAQCRHYRGEGYLILRRVFTPAEVAELSAEADALLGRTDLLVPNNLRTRWKPHVETGEPLFEVFDPFLDLAPVGARLAVDPRLLDALACLYGEEACLFKDKLIYKPPGAVGATLHQDWIAWPGFPRSFLTVVVAIDPFAEDNGCTEVFPRCHTRGYLSPTDGQHHQLEVGQLDVPDAVPLLLGPGDVAVFGCFMPHRSAPNRSRRWRRGLFLSYNALSEGGHQREAHYREFDAWRKAKMSPEALAGLIYR